MSKRIPQEKLDFLNSLLDKELEELEQPIQNNFFNQSNQKDEADDSRFFNLSISGQLYMSIRFHTI
jgi:hypothetical protein